jgi:hypothetical protein
MSPNHRLRRSLPTFLLLAALLFAGLPAQAAAVHRPSAVVWKVAVLGEGALSWLRNLFSGLWMRGSAKEGVTIDPDGKPNQTPPPDEGVTIDPNG